MKSSADEAMKGPIAFNRTEHARRPYGLFSCETDFKGFGRGNIIYWLCLNCKFAVTNNNVGSPFCLARLPSPFVCLVPHVYLQCSPPETAELPLALACSDAGRKTFPGEMGKDVERQASFSGSNLFSSSSYQVARYANFLLERLLRALFTAPQWGEITPNSLLSNGENCRRESEKLPKRPRRTTETRKALSQAWPRNNKVVLQLFLSFMEANDIPHR
ncbi:hypothetical protein RRG08_038951 [Elysia crispata]|uniref:Uncharacterized protein n=1 Tax=Elysia crispata TaxID=231223 RepID=A0AAE0Y7B9_9GAST|nr:hypothetical protein RRG08_038951 [Elysia crispata]